jgi:hypothetical protein
MIDEGDCGAKLCKKNTENNLSDVVRKWCRNCRLTMSEARISGINVASNRTVF